jgi:nucleoside-diphosphate-sugar epimerase
MTITQFAEAIRELTGSQSEIVHEPLPTDDPKVRQPDIRLAKEKLGWEPQVPLEVGLRETIQFFQEAGY